MRRLLFLALAISTLAHAQDDDLPAYVRGSFADGHGTDVEFSHGVRAYQVYGGGRERPGGFLALTPPESPPSAQNVLALPVENAATLYDEVIIRNRTRAIVGEVAEQRWADGTFRDGGAQQIYVREADRENIVVVQRGLPVPNDVPDYARRFLPTAEQYLRSTAGWEDYRRTPPPEARPIPIESAMRTDPAPILDATRDYGRFPGGVLLETQARFAIAPSAIAIERRGDRAFFRIDAMTYDPELSLEELALLQRAAMASDPLHVGAVAQDRVHGTEPDGVVARWLEIADTELGAYAYGCDTRPELLHPNAPGYPNPTVRLLDGVAALDIAAILRDVSQLATGFQPRLFLRSREVTFAPSAGRLQAVDHRIEIDLEVFRNAGAQIELWPGALEDAQPFVLDAVRWLNDHIREVVARSGALQRIARYGEVLALMRYARARGIAIEGAEILGRAYEQRSHRELVPDVYVAQGPALRGRRRASALVLESRIDRGPELAPVATLAAWVEVLVLALGSDDLDLAQRARARVIGAAADPSIAPELAQWSRALASRAVSLDVAAPIAKADELVGDGRRDLANVFFAAAERACERVRLGGVDVEAHREVCARAHPRVAEAADPLVIAANTAVATAVVLAFALWWWRRSIARRGRAERSWPSR